MKVVDSFFFNSGLGFPQNQKRCFAVLFKPFSCQRVREAQKSPLAMVGPVESRPINVKILALAGDLLNSVPYRYIWRLGAAVQN